MASSSANTEAEITLASAYDGLFTLNKTLQTVQKSIRWSSQLWKLMPGYSEDEEYPGHWSDLTAELSWDDPDKVAWLQDAARKNLFQSRPALREELERLGSLKNTLEEVQTEHRNLINELSRPALRPLHIFDLPDEVLSGVFALLHADVSHIPSLSHVGSPDIRNCRLVCQRFCQASSRFLIQSVSVDLRLSSLSRFQGLSQHPFISKGIKVIRTVLHFYDPTLSSSMPDFIAHHADELEDRIDLMERTRSWDTSETTEETGQRVLGHLKAVLASWRRLESQSQQPEQQEQQEGLEQQQQQQQQPGNQGDQSSPSNEEDEMHRGLLTGAHQGYQKLFLEQEELRNSGRFYQIIADGLANMPRVRTLYFIDWHEMKIEQPSLFAHDDVNVPLYEGLLRPHNYDTAYQYELSPQLCEVMAELSAAVPRSIEHVEMDLTYVETPSDLVPRPEIRRQLSSSLQQLRIFAFRCQKWLDDDAGEDALCDVLSPWLDTPGLEELTINITSDEGSPVQAMPSVGGVIARDRPQKMSRVCLQGVAFQLTELQLFIRGLQEPHCHLYLERNRLLNGTWADALDSLRETTIETVTLVDPQGAECDSMSPEELSIIFSKGSFAWSEAEEYIRHFKLLNPLRDRMT